MYKTTQSRSIQDQTTQKRFFHTITENLNNGAKMWSVIRQLTASNNRKYSETKWIIILPKSLIHHFPHENACFSSSLFEDVCCKTTKPSQFFFLFLKYQQMTFFITFWNKQKNSLGFDGISLSIFKLSAPCTVDCLTYLYNLCLDKCCCCCCSIYVPAVT